jgi:D-alanine-D-alanine ligase
MRIALLHNARPARPPAGLPDDAFEEFDAEETVASIAGALERWGAEVEPVPADRRLPWRLTERRFDFAFNIAEGEGRRCREAIPAAVCELLGVPFTGSDALTLAVTLDKEMARRVVSPDLPVARAILHESEADDALLTALEYPVLVKPNDEGSSKGIREDAVSHDARAAAEACRRLHARYGCPGLVEEFLPGPEVTVGIVGNGAQARVLGMMEIAPADGEGPFVYSVEVKRDFRRRVSYCMPPRLPAAALDALARRALAAFRLLGCRDVARFDFRLDAAGEPRFLECNPLPGLNPESSDLVILSRAVLPYDDLVCGILIDAAERFSVPLP